MRLTLISGRDPTHMLNQALATVAKASGPVEVLVHPWATVHPADGARAFKRMIKVSGPRHLVIVTVLDWLFNLVGEIIELRPTLLDHKEVEVMLCEGGKVETFTFCPEGFIPHWPIGYFTCD